MNLWEHERVLASAHSSVHMNKLNMMQRQLRGMEEKAAVVEKRSQVALREVCPSLDDPDDTLCVHVPLHDGFQHLAETNAYYYVWTQCARSTCLSLAHDGTTRHMCLPMSTAASLPGIDINLPCLFPTSGACSDRATGGGRGGVTIRERKEYNSLEA
jgi:hypothetical protein